MWHNEVTFEETWHDIWVMKWLGARHEFWSDMMQRMSFDLTWHSICISKWHGTTYEFRSNLVQYYNIWVSVWLGTTHEFWNDMALHMSFEKTWHNTYVSKWHDTTHAFFQWYGACTSFWYYFVSQFLKCGFLPIAISRIHAVRSKWYSFESFTRSTTLSHLKENFVLKKKYEYSELVQETIYNFLYIWTKHRRIESAIWIQNMFYF